MLYTASVMKNNPSVPDELIMFDRQFSWRTAWIVGRWCFVAIALSATCDVFFGAATTQWPFGLRVGLVVGEFVALALFWRDVARWIRGMDELQRRITGEVLLFAVAASFIFFLLWLRLERVGFFHAVFGPPIWNDSWGISSVAHAGVLLGGFYGLGFLIFKRRYN
jgi:hypothetical protein